MDAVTMHRWHFAFTITYHYIFPQLTMGLALLILVLKTVALHGGDEHYNRSARFWVEVTYQTIHKNWKDYGCSI